jgi:hypothetical protein
LPTNTTCIENAKSPFENRKEKVQWNRLEKFHPFSLTKQISK